jgi:uncharacterized membrane protein YfcA
LTQLPDLAPFQWLLGVFAAFFVGVAKTGVPGLGIVVVPMMVLAVGDAKLSAAWLLPILCTADVFAIIYWRRHASAKKLFGLAPWVLLGILAGAAALALSETVLRPMIGTIVLIMLLVYLYRQHRPAKSAAGAPAAPYGIAAGFATTVANAAGPVMSLYLLSKRLPKEEFVATGAWFFFFVNLTKIPVYVFHGLFSRQSLAFDAAMVPAVMAGAMAGRWLITRIPARVFELLVVTLAAASTLLLFR